MTHTVKIVDHQYELRRYGGVREVHDYTVYLNDVKLRCFSTHGSMEEGYWGTAAERMAVQYAGPVARTLGVQVQRCNQLRD